MLFHNTKCSQLKAIEDKNSYNRAEDAPGNYLFERTKSIMELSVIGIICFIMTHGIMGNLNRNSNKNSRRNKMLVVPYSNMELPMCIIFSS